MKGNRTEKLKNCENNIRKTEKKRYSEMKRRRQKREKECLLINNISLI